LTINDLFRVSCINGHSSEFTFDFTLTSFLFYWRFH